MYLRCFESVILSTELGNISKRLVWLSFIEWLHLSEKHFIRYIKICFSVPTVDFDVSSKNENLTFLELFYLYFINEHHLSKDKYL